MYISIGNKTYDIDNTYVFRLGRLVNTGEPKNVYADYVYNGKTQCVR